MILDTEQRMEDREWKLSEHLCGFSALQVSATSTRNSMAEFLKRFGEVKCVTCNNVDEGFAYLLPIKSFTTKYLILQVDAAWSLLVTDMARANCYVEAYGVSRMTKCTAMGIFCLETRREFQLFEDGKKIRIVESSQDGNEWHFREEGYLQPFEDISEYRRRRKSQRLSCDAVARYFQAVTGMTLPIAWRSIQFQTILGLERSTKDLQNPLLHYRTVMDV